MDETTAPRSSKGFIFFRVMLWKEINTHLITDPYVLRYKVDMAWFLLPPDKRRIYEVEAALISDPSSPVLNPLYYQQGSEEYMKYIKEQSRFIKNPYEVFRELGYDPHEGFEYERKKRTPSNDNLYLRNNEEPLNLVKEKKESTSLTNTFTKVQNSDSLIGQEAISLRQSGFLYFVETCRLNFNYLGGSVLKFNNNCWKAWSVLSDEIKDKFQASAEQELNNLRYNDSNNSDLNTTMFPHGIHDLYLIDLKFTLDKYESLILGSYRNQVDNIFSHARSTTTDSVKLRYIAKEHTRRRKRVNPQGLATKVDPITSKEKKRTQMKMESLEQEDQITFIDSLRDRSSNGRSRKDPNAPKKPM